MEQQRQQKNKRTNKAQQPQRNRRQNKSQQPQGGGPRFSMNWIYGLVILGLIAFWYTNGGAENSSVKTETSYSDFKTMVAKGYAREIVVNKHAGTLQMYVKPEHIYDVFHQHVQ